MTKPEMVNGRPSISAACVMSPASTHLRTSVLLTTRSSKATGCTTSTLNPSSSPSAVSTSAVPSRR